MRRSGTVASETLASVGILAGRGPFYNCCCRPFYFLLARYVLECGWRAVQSDIGRERVACRVDAASGFGVGCGICGRVLFQNARGWLGSHASLPVGIRKEKRSQVVVSKDNPGAPGRYFGQ